MTAPAQRHCIRFPSQRMRICVEEDRHRRGWVVRVVTPAASSAVSIRTHVHLDWEAAREAFVSKLVATGNGLMEIAYERLRKALKVWQCGRVGIRAGSGAAFDLVLIAAYSVVEVALPCARTLTRLMESGGLTSDGFEAHDWLQCALEDLREGLTEEEAGRRLANDMRAS